jgi:hypothetical protein
MFLWLNPELSPAELNSTTVLIPLLVNKLIFQYVFLLPQKICEEIKKELLEE